MNYRYVKVNGNVVVYLMLLLVTCAKSPSACNFEHSSISSNFLDEVRNLTSVLFKDYEVPVVSNFELDNHCLELWHAHDIYTMLKALTKKAEHNLKERIETLLTELSFLENCFLLVPRTCTKHKQPLVTVLQKLEDQHLKSISGNYSNCTSMRCVSGKIIPHTDQPVDFHDNVTTTNSTEAQDAGTPTNEEYLQQKKSEPSNKTALSQLERDRLPMAFLLILLVIGVIAIVIYFAKRKLYGGNHDMVEPNEIACTSPLDLQDLHTQTGEQS